MTATQIFSIAIVAFAVIYFVWLLIKGKAMDTDGNSKNDSDWWEANND